MGKGQELVKNTAIISIGKIASQMVSFFLLPLYTSILSTEDYGNVDLVTTYVQLFLPIATCQMEQSMFRFLLDNRNTGKKETVISEIFTINTLLSLVFLLIFFAVAPWIRSEAKYFFLFNLYASIFSSLMLQVARGLGKNADYAVGSFLIAGGQVILSMIFVVVLRLGFRGMLAATFLAHIMCGIYLVIRTGTFRCFRFVKLTRDNVIPYAKYSLPLVPNTISWWILSASDRTIILRYLGIGANGIYSAANKFSGIYTTIYNIFNLSWLETVSLYLHEPDGQKVFSELQAAVIKFFSCAALGLTAVMPFVFHLLVNEKFGVAYYQIPILLAGAYFSAMTGVLGAYYTAEKMTSAIAKMTMSAAALNVIINIVFVQFWGLYAASMSTLLSYAAVFVLRYRDVKKRFGVAVDRKIFVSIGILSVIVWIPYYQRSLIWSAAALLVICVYSVIVNYPLIKPLLQIIQKKH